ncbi:guanylate-binding protein 4 [Artemisia annua]|uniref:Guanylate-binding protein 4 n=1 Tax=Artemisia annua TaxID=35608 RepID=A0A2U1MQG8_ARTAN|nr:guanylate-binding protein 4 [Artemisia annua]
MEQTPDSPKVRQPFGLIIQSIFHGNTCAESFFKDPKWGYVLWFPIIEPDPGHTKLRLSSEGLEAIKRIKNPIAAVAVIGPYRSGKSFLLNQLLSLSCYEGIWVWGTPVEMDIDGVTTSVFYLDTEGFESIGKSNVYDDRMFALATVLSSVLIYNLPETIYLDLKARNDTEYKLETFSGVYRKLSGKDVVFEYPMTEA